MSEFAAVVAPGFSIARMGIADLTGIEYFTALESLDCPGNLLTKLDLSHNTSLEFVQCTGCDIKELNASGCKALKTLYCQDNQLEKLDVTGCTALRSMECVDNKLKTLDVKPCPKLVLTQNSKPTISDGRAEYVAEANETIQINENYSITITEYYLRCDANLAITSKTPAANASPSQTSASGKTVAKANAFKSATLKKTLKKNAVAKKKQTFIIAAKFKTKTTIT